MLYSALFAVLLGLRRVRGANFYWLILVVLFLFSAFRFEVGCDWLGYIFQYRAYQNYYFEDFVAERESVWAAILIFANFMSIPYAWLNVLTSLFFFVGLHNFAKRQPDRMLFVVLAFPTLILNMPMAASRQGMAIGILFFALGAFLERRFFRFVLITVFAALIHTSAVVFLMLLPFLKPNVITGKHIVYAGILFLPAALSFGASDLSNTISTRYLSSGIDSTGAYFRLLQLLATALFYRRYLKTGWEKYFPTDYKLANLGSYLLFIPAILLPISSTIADRFGYYMLPIQIMILARTTYVASSRQLGNLYYFAYAMSFVMLVGWTSFSGIFAVCYTPYNSWIFGYPSTRFEIDYTDYDTDLGR